MVKSILFTKTKVEKIADCGIRTCAPGGNLISSGSIRNWLSKQVDFLTHKFFREQSQNKYFEEIKDWGFLTTEILGTLKSNCSFFCFFYNVESLEKYLSVNVEIGQNRKKAKLSENILSSLRVKWDLWIITIFIKIGFVVEPSYQVITLLNSWCWLINTNIWILYVTYDR